jgi:hypothetical protein
LPHLKSEEDLANLYGTLSFEKPNTRLYEFRGKLVLENNKEM